MPDYNFDACLLRRVQNYQKRQIAWFEPRHKALVLIPNINERSNWSSSRADTVYLCGAVIRPKSSGIQSFAAGTYMPVAHVQVSTRKDTKQKQQKKQL